MVGILPGEGIGPEVIAATLAVLDALQAAQLVRLERRVGGPIGLGAGVVGDGAVTQEVVEFCRQTFEDGGAVLCGPGGGRFVYDLRAQFDLYCKIVPLRPMAALHRVSPLKEKALKDVDILVVRDNAGGIYQGRWGVRDDPAEGRTAEHHFSYTEAQVERIVRAGARLAQSRRGRMDVIVNDGGIPSSSDLWRATAERIAAEMGVACAFRNVDFAAYALIQHPQQFDVLVSPNLIGDILADLGAVFLGSRGLSFSGNFSACGRAVYQTGHGAAKDLAGTDRANPVGQILSMAMMLRESYRLDDAADIVERAVESIFRSGYRTDDLAEPGCHCIGTRQMGELIAAEILSLASTMVPA